jgi:Fur family transcriptional regulator, iron response regulator
MNDRFVASTELCQDGSLSGDLHDLLRSKVGLRPTRQRIAISKLLLRDPNRRVTAEILYDEAHEARCPVSRSAVGRALRQFEQAGLLRRIAIDQSKESWFVIANATVDLS